MNIKTVNTFSERPRQAPPASLPPSSCPVLHSAPKTAPACCSDSPSSPNPISQGATTQQSSSSLLSKLNPLNYMFSNLSQTRAPNQRHALPTSREESTIPRGAGDGNWEYPSPQQMYNALLRKGYTDTDVTAVESMVAVHNFLNEGAWAEVVEWERRFCKGLVRGWHVCSRGEENAEGEIRRLVASERMQARAASGATTGVTTPATYEPKLARFQGRPKDMTPKAAMLQTLGWLYPAKFG